MNVQGAVVLAFEDRVPRIDPGAWVAHGATVIGDVRLAAHASVWYGTVVRGDDAPITIGANSNVQDGSVLHADPGYPLHIAENVTVGHRAVLHGCVVERDCLIGMGAVLLNGCRVGAGSLVAAGALLREGTVVPPGSLVAGMPATVRRPVGDAESALITESWHEYVDKADRHRRVVPVDPRARGPVPRSAAPDGGEGREEL